MLEKVKFAFIFFFIINCSVNSQELLRKNIKSPKSSLKVYRSYMYNDTVEYGIIKLWLYENGSFYYTYDATHANLFTEGRWSIDRNILTLTSTIQDGFIPVKLFFSNDSAQTINGFRIGIVRNLKGVKMEDGLVAINTDSNMCAPSYALCDQKFESIDSIKIVFENKLHSSWIKVKKREYNVIIPIVQTNFLISSYLSFNKRKYIINKSGLELISYSSD